VILRDLADTFDVIDRAVLTVGAGAAFVTAVLVLAVILIAGAVTGLWADQTADEPATEYEEAA
jgi:hypothetical protein